MTDNELLLALSDIIDTKLKPIKNDIKDLKSNVDNTKQDIILRMDDMEHDILNTCLGYTDEQDESIISKLDNVQSTVNSASRLKTIDNDLYNATNLRLDKMQKEIDILKQKVS